MSLMPLADVLALVGGLESESAADRARDRFRRFLCEHVTDLEDLRDYYQQCRAGLEEDYQFAMPELVAHLGRFWGCDVAFGTGAGLPGEASYLARWVLPLDLHVILEVDPSGSLTARRPRLAVAIESLINEGRISSWDSALGLYVAARPGLRLTHLERAILDEKGSRAIRIVSAERLFALVGLAASADLTPAEIFAILRSSGPRSDDLVALIQRLADREPAGAEPPHREGSTIDLGAALEALGDRFVSILELLVRPSDIETSRDDRADPV